MSIQLLIPLIISLLASLALVPIVRWISFKNNKVSIPRADRWHRKPTPTLGGIGIFIAFALAVLIGSYIVPDSSLIVQRWSILTGITIMFAVGLVDDFFQISPPAKLVFQILAATLVIFFGNNTIDFFRWPIANIFLTFFWLVGITNAINLLDNMDGLASGVALIASIFLSIFFWKSGHTELLILSLSLSGSILGFFGIQFPPCQDFYG